jgi:putative NIF3 family GTP cyclohydrolase 1 type 2
MGTNPYVGKQGELHREDELKIEVIFPAWLEDRIIKSLLSAHPYEEVAYDIIKLENRYSTIGSGVIGDLTKPVDVSSFFKILKERFKLRVIKHTQLLAQPVKRIAVCGGAGSFLIPNALAAGADIFITSDIKYHEFFDANDEMVIVDIGHYESEQFTINLLQEFLEQKFPTFAVLKTEVNTNPVQYFL